MSGAGTRFSHETEAATEQASVGVRQRLIVTVLSKVDIAPAVESALPFSVLPIFKMIAPSATTVPRKVAPPPKVN